MNGQTEIVWGEEVEVKTDDTSERRQCQLGDLVELVTKGTTPSTLGGRFVEKGINFIKSEAIGYNGRIDATTFVCIDEVTHAKLKRSQLKENDILFSMAGIYLGKNAIVTKQFLPANTNQALAIIRLDKTKAETKFIHYYLRQESVTELVNNMSGQSAQPNINFQEIRSIDILLPELEEQRAIAGLLSSLDDKIDLLHRQNATLEALAETLFRQWFVEQAKEEWEDCALEELCLTVTSGGTPSTKIESYYNGDINWYSTKELKDNFLFQSESKITQEGLKNSAAKIFPIDTVIIAIYAAPTVGRLGILTNNACFNQAACGLVANIEFCSFEFLYLFLKYQRAELNAMASGSAQQNLNVGKIRAYPAFKVPGEYMSSFVDVVRPLFSKIKENSTQIRTLSTLRDTLLPKLMSGEVRVAY